jgi:hypothetical protein
VSGRFFFNDDFGYVGLIRPVATGKARELRTCSLIRRAKRGRDGCRKPSRCRNRWTVLVHTASYSARARSNDRRHTARRPRLHLRSRNLQLLPNRRGRVADLFDRSARLIRRNMEAAPPVLQLRWFVNVLAAARRYLPETDHLQNSEMTKRGPIPGTMRSRVDEATPARAAQSACPAEPMRKCQARSSPRERLASRTSNKNPGMKAGAREWRREYWS